MNLKKSLPITFAKKNILKKDNAFNILFWVVVQVRLETLIK